VVKKDKRGISQGGEKDDRGIVRVRKMMRGNCPGWRKRELSGGGKMMRRELSGVEK